MRLLYPQSSSSSSSSSRSIIFVTHLLLLLIIVTYFSDSKFIESSSIVYKTIIVDQNYLDHGNYHTIQSAIDSIPSNNNRWIVIHVRPGVYREEVTIPKDKPFIVLEGEGSTRTTIEYGNHGSLDQTPTFTLQADNFVARFISFKNTYNYNNDNNPRDTAVAALIAGNKSAFYSCGFFGVQDTLWDAQGLHYFRECYIEGVVDFIFGAGQSIYEKCAISVNGQYLDKEGVGLAGFISAQGRENSKDTNGFVFKHCNVFGSGKAHLGRAWRSHSRVLFYRSNLSEVIVPQGWDAWDYRFHEDRITFAEFGCEGNGSSLSERVKWLKKLSRKEVFSLSQITFIDKEGWLQKQP